MPFLHKGIYDYLKNVASIDRVLNITVSCNKIPKSFAQFHTNALTWALSWGVARSVGDGETL